MSRVLHYFHVTHTRAETHLNPTPTEAWIVREWERAERIIDSLELPFDQTKIYQDSLPDLSHSGYKTVNHAYPSESALLKLEDMKKYRDELGIPDPPNDRILRDLVQLGCQLMVTEDLRHVEILAYLWEEMPPDLHFLLQELQIERDHSIAQRINYTLQDGETGILFLGKDHRIADKLDVDIEVHHYFDNASVR